MLTEKANFWYCQTCNINFGMFDEVFNIGQDMCPYCFALLDLIIPQNQGELNDTLDMQVDRE